MVTDAIAAGLRQRLMMVRAWWPKPDHLTAGREQREERSEARCTFRGTFLVT